MSNSSKHQTEKADHIQGSILEGGVFLVAIISLATMSCLAVNAQYTSPGPYGSNQNWGNRGAYSYEHGRIGNWQSNTNRNQRHNRPPFNNTYVQINNGAWNDSLKRLNKDLEAFANQLAVYLITPGRPSTQGAQEAQLVQELNMMRQEVSMLIADSNSARNAQYWQSQVQNLYARGARINMMVNIVPNYLVTQRWAVVNSDLNNLNSTLY